MEPQEASDRTGAPARPSGSVVLGTAPLKRDSSLTPEEGIHIKRQKQEGSQTTLTQTTESATLPQSGSVEGPPKEPLPAVVTLSRIDKASTIQLSECLMKATSRKGYRTVRATHGVSEGCWYFEVKIEHLGQTGHCRVGWATKQAHLHAPVGFDQHGYSYRDIEGTKQHKADRLPYGAPYSTGDVIGCLIYLPKPEKTEDTPMQSESQAQEETVPQSCIGFFKNGDYQGPAFKTVLKGSYFPAVSMFTSPDQVEGVTLKINFGPNFDYPPNASIETTVIPQPDATSLESILDGHEGGVLLLNEERPNVVSNTVIRGDAMKLKATIGEVKRAKV